MAPAGPPEEPARGASPRSAGSLLGARLLELGRLRAGSVEEFLVIEASPATGRAANFGHTTSSPAGPAAEDVEQEKEDQRALATDPGQEEVDPIVEADLALEDFDVEQEVSLRDLWAALPDPWAPGSARGRELMLARAKQCVICMEDKEHTLVPLHEGCGEGGNLEGHRVCTDCWEELLQHELDRHWDWLHSRQGPPPALTCPVCRAGVTVPDAWDAELDLPEEWVQRPKAKTESWATPRRRSCRPVELGDAPAAQPEPSQKWACAAAGPAALEGAGRSATDSAPAATGAGAAGMARCCSLLWGWLCCDAHASSGEEFLAEAAEVADAPVPPL